MADKNTANCSCVESKSIDSIDKKEKYIIDIIETKIGKIPVVSTKLRFSDIIGEWRVRWNIFRMNYIVKPGLYGVGKPTPDSPVLVSANYKLSFDKLRKELNGINAWVLVLDTKGINVWCAAGKGTFGTKELIMRILLTKLEKLINHKTLIVPQLGAVGVSAPDVKKITDFRVIYGPVRACDIPVFLNNNYKKAEGMRTMYFKFIDRIILTPIEFVASLKYILLAFILISTLSVIETRALSLKIIYDFIPFFGAFLTGAVIFPILLPYIPFRSFAVKGYILGIIWTIAIIFLYHFSFIGILINLMILPVITSFLALNFTGASTFTSLTGAKLEVKISLPIFIALIAGGIIIKILNFIKII